MEGLLLIAAIAIMAFYFGWSLPYWATKLLTHFERKKMLKEVMPQKINHNKICKSPHSWLDVPSINAEGQMEDIKVCKECGLIPSRNLMASTSLIKHMLNRMEIDKLDNKIQQDFIDKENKDIMKVFEEELKNGMPMEKIEFVYEAGQTAIKRFHIYKMARSEELKREIKDNS